MLIRLNKNIKQTSTTDDALFHFTNHIACQFVLRPLSYRGVKINMAHCHFILENCIVSCWIYETALYIEIVHLNLTTYLDRYIEYIFY